MADIDVHNNNNNSSSSFPPPIKREKEESENESDGGDDDTNKSIESPKPSTATTNNKKRSRPAAKNKKNPNPTTHIPFKDIESEIKNSSNYSKKSCWACKEMALANRKLDKDMPDSQRISIFDPILELISMASFSISTADLVSRIKQKYDDDIRPTYDPEYDPGEWTEEQIHEHLYEHMADVTLEIRAQIDSYRAIVKKTKDRLFTVNNDDDGNIELNKDALDNTIRLNKEIIRIFSSDVRKYVGFNKHIAPVTSSLKEEKEKPERGTVNMNRLI